MRSTIAKPQGVKRGRKEDEEVAEANKEVEPISQNAIRRWRVARELLETQGEIQRLNMLGECAHRNEVNAGFREGAQGLLRDVTGNLK